MLGSGPPDTKHVSSAIPVTVYSVAMEREPIRETTGKADKVPLYMKLYFQEVYTEVARVVGYAGFRTVAVTVNVWPDFKVPLTAISTLPAGFGVVDLSCL